MCALVTGVQTCALPIYFEAFDSYFPGAGIEYYYYDQLGSAYSEQPILDKGRDDSLWTTERFVEEVEQVRQALHLDKDNFCLLGQSWGGILAMEYALKYQQHLKRSEEHTSELQSLIRNSYAVFCLKKKHS